MTTATQDKTESRQSSDVQRKISELRALYADVPQFAKTALENTIKDLTRGGVAAAITDGKRWPDRRPSGQGCGVDRDRPVRNRRGRPTARLLQLRNGNFDDTDRVGTVHDMRFVFLDNDTKLLFATAYDGDWDIYIEDFVAKIPNEMDVLFSCWEGWPGIHSPQVKDWIAKHQVTAEGWYVAHPDLTVAETRQVKRVGKAVEEFLDKISG